MEHCTVMECSRKKNLSKTLRHNLLIITHHIAIFNCYSAHFLDIPWAQRHVVPKLLTFIWVHFNTARVYIKIRSEIKSCGQNINTKEAHLLCRETVYCKIMSTSDYFFIFIIHFL